MRNLSKTIVSKKVSLIDKDLTMKIIYFVIATVVMTFAANAIIKVEFEVVFALVFGVEFG